ncbi:MAG TPA: hypothetical protein VLT47_12195, partial [Anaeromyxobacteraceae bacterium]|nr:hypothetical protein [Anaeromyxobacteraceae bacterium]
VNLDGVSDWSNPFFADLIKQGRPWNAIGSLSTPVPVDANGWPTGDAQIVIATPPAMVARAEPYKLSFLGNATVTALGGQVANKVYDAAANTTTADVYITAPDPAQPHRNGNFFLSFSGQPGGVKNVRLLRPGHAPSEIFSRDLLARISWFSTLRLGMFLGPSNKQVTANTDREWSDRGLPGYALQTIDAPAWEYVTLLANTARKDVWIAIPYYASDAYITRLAQLFKYGSDGVNPYTSPQANPVYPPLDPDRKVYFEYANEIWNSVYPTTAQNVADAQAEVAAGDPHHLAYVAGNKHELGWRRVGWLILRTSDLFRSVFGDAEMMTRIRPVLARQFVYRDTFNQPLNYLQAVYGPGNAYGNPGYPISHYLYGIAGAPYVNVLSADIGREDLTVDGVFASMQSYLDTVIKPGITWLTAKARELGVAAVAYEAGQHLLPSQGSAASKLAAQMDPRMATLSLSVLDAWAAAGGGVLNYYSLCSAWGTYGYWGLSPDITSEATPKWDAVKTFVSR